MKNSFCRFVLLLSASALLCSLPMAALQAKEVPVAISSDGSLLLKTAENHQGLSLVSCSDGKESLIAKTLGAGYYASLSPNKKFVCYKQVQIASNGKRTFAPMLYNVATRKSTALAKPSSDAGTPAMSADGKIAFTVGNTLTILDAKKKKLGAFDLGHPVNLIAISPDGSQIAYNDKKEQIVLLSLSGARRVLTDGSASFWGPKFSPKGDQLLANSADGRVFSIALGKGKEAVKELGKGLDAAWLNSDTVAYTKKDSDGKEVTKTELRFVSPSSGASGAIKINDGDADAIVSGSSVAVSQDSKLLVGSLNSGTGILSVLTPLVSKGLLDAIKPEPNAESSDTISRKVAITGVPYIHQAWDTPDYFCGDWACGATSAVMTLTYYNLLPNWDITCSAPTPHVSHFGRYICDTYTYNSQTFDIVGKDCANRRYSGGYGYIIQGNWIDTKGYMAQYIAFHGPSSAADFSTNYAKAVVEVDAQTPFVLLNTLTTAGHYCVVIGYTPGQYTLTFNDPYGNKNLGTYPNYTGTNVTYDWPGYNYGHQNLNTVECYIYSRYTLPGPSNTPTNTPVGGPPTSTPTSGTNIIVDDTDPGFAILSGSWVTGTSSLDKYGADYRYNTCGTGADQAQWSANLQDGTYDVYAWWPQGSNRATDAPFTVNYSGGSQTMTRNQQTSGGVWNLLGSFNFTAGTWTVSLSDNGVDGLKVVMADAIRWVWVSGPPPTNTPTNTPTEVVPPTNTPTETPTAPTNTPSDTPTNTPTFTPTIPPTDTPTATNTPVTYIIDDGDSAYTKSGTWTANTNQGAEPLNGDFDSAATVTGAATKWAKWTPNLAAAGSYKVYVRYKMATTRPIDAPYTVYYNGGNQTVDVNQTVNGGAWALLGTYNFAAGSAGYVQLNNGPATVKNKTLCADSVKLELQ